MVPSIFRASEILDMAIEVEQQGIAFYGACINSIDSPRLRGTFDHLIDQEHNHLKVFSEMKKGSGDFKLPEGYPGENERLVAGFVRNRVFGTPEKAAEAARKLGGAREAVDLAVGFEEKSIAFYDFVMERVRASDRGSVGRIIEEERRHIDRLNRLRRELEEA